ERTETGAGDLAEVGVVAEVLQIARRGPQRYTIVVRTVQRVRMVEMTSGEGDLLIARVEPLTLVEPTSPELGARVRDHLVRILADKSDGSPEKIAADLGQVEDADDLVDLAAGHLDLDREELVVLLLETDVSQRLTMVIPGLERLTQVIERKADIRRELTESSPDEREAALRQRLRAIAEELGEADEETELGEYLERIAKAGMPDEVRKAARKQVARMRAAGTSSPEHGIARNYLEWLLDLPWSEQTIDQ